MDGFDWSPDYSVGNEILDFQHKALIDMFNDIKSKTQLSQAEQNNYFLFLSHYVANHFTTEERLMREHHYPSIEAHLVEHENIKSRIEELIYQHHREEISSEQLADFLKQWIVNHILHSDMAYKDYIADKK
jgi:hemerythrin-like metal-binding protein